VIETKFINDQSVRTRLSMHKQSPVRGLPYITVPKRSRSHAESIVSIMGSAQRPISY
jgi:hypothetical protein